MIAQNVEAMFSGFSRLRDGADIIMHGVENRTALAAVELVEVRRKAVVSAVVGALCAAAVLLVGVAATFLVAAIFWDTPHRVTALGGMMGLEIVFVVASLLWLRSRWAGFTAFPATREQLRKDSQCIHELLALRDQ